ncbi:MFS transporter [Casimicrobium huifangae]|uniref:MFS transporter n=1 Tax=Casimicrobium huifangae TaxID=2591109 RepID=UPI002B57C2DE|nr:MFS transporter [Casimicrobium huifangae]
MERITLPEPAADRPAASQPNPPAATSGAAAPADRVSAPAGALPRELFVLVAFLIVAHTAFNGIRITTSLAAIKAGGGALWVGLLTAMFNIVPAFVAIRVGRLVDRVPLRRPLIAGCALVAAGGAIAAIEPMLGILALCAIAIGIGWMAIAASSQYAVGLFGGSENRVRAFSVMSMGFSISSFLGPLIAGFMIDHVSYRAAFAVLAALPAIAAIAFATRWLKLPAVAPREDAPNGGARELLGMPAVRNTLISAAFITVGWDLYIFMVPVLGTELHLTATQIGSVLSFFAVAVFVVRLFMTRLTDRLGERGVMVSAMAVAGVTFIAFGFAHSYGVMMALSFVIGLGLGASQPIVLSILHDAAPPGRIGEVNGMRMTMISTSQWTMPLVFGMLSASTGMLPLFLIIGGGILSGSWFARRKLPTA